MGHQCSIISAALALLPKGEPTARIEECARRGVSFIARRTVAESDVAAAGGIAGDAASHRVAPGVDTEARATAGDAAAIGGGDVTLDGGVGAEVLLFDLRRV